MGATTAHRAPKEVADGTCTQVEAWMTNKCRTRINERDIYIYVYITTEISQREGRKKKKSPKKGEKGSWDARGVGSSHPRARGPFSLGRRVAWFSAFFTTKTGHHPIRAQLLDPLSTNSL